MGDKTKIEWTDATWNPVTGCTKVSEGCRFCYIDRTPPFRIAGRKFESGEVGASTGVILHPERLDQPLRWQRPRLVFVNSLADLFHDDVPDEFIIDVFKRMWWAKVHTFQVLTKRPARMRALLSRMEPVLRQIESDLVLVDCPTPLEWPLPNVWIGVSVEDQGAAELRIPKLLETPAAVRFLSCEPLLGPLNLTRVAWTGGGGTHLNVVHGIHGVPDVWGTPAKSVDWVIVGGESGPGARPMHPDWARSLRDQCASAGVPFLFKQHGEWTQRVSLLDTKHRRMQCVDEDLIGPNADARMWRIGKKAAGRELDGRVHDEFPAELAGDRRG